MLRLSDSTRSGPLTRPAVTFAACAFALTMVGPCSAASRRGPLTIRKVNLAEKTLPGRGDFLFGVAAGPSWSTEFAVAARLSALAALDQEGGPHGETGPRLTPLIGGAGGTVLTDMLTSPTTDLGIVPAPVLEAAARARPGLRERIGYVAPLYLETVHVVARREFASVEALRGRRVAVGEADGVGATLLRSLGVSVDASDLTGAEALDAVRSGSVDGVILVSGDPVQVLSSLPPDAALHVLPVTYDQALGPDFLPARLTHADYPSLVAEGGADVVAVQAVLAAYLRYPKGERAQTLGSLVISVLNHAGSRETSVAGDKLRDANWAATLPGWTRLPSVQSWLNARAPRPAPPVAPSRP